MRTGWAAAAALCMVGTASAAPPTEATYISKEDVEKVRRAPGTDRNIRVVDIGHENFAVGIVSRGRTVKGVQAGSGGTRASAAAPSCGRPAPASATDGMAGGITHDGQAEGYYIVSGGGDLFTGGYVAEGRKLALAELNGPTCIGTAHGATVRTVKAGDIIIIPAGVVHGWSEIPDHVDYLSFRPSPNLLQAGWAHPALKE